MSGARQNKDQAATVTDIKSSPPLSFSESSSSSSSSSSLYLKAHTRKRSKAMAISPRSANYERLEGGMGPSRMQGRHFAWKKFAVGAAIIIGLVWFVGPRETRSFSWSSPKNDYTSDIETIPDYDAALTNTRTSIPTSTPVTSHLNGDAQSKPNASSSPVTFESDPDASKTTHCTKPHTPGISLVQYALMIDAGSTGSRIHIYKFNNCGLSPTFEWEVFHQTKPGLSGYAHDPLGAAKSLDVLMDEAMRVVPVALRKCTPVAVKATAGLRLLAGSQADDILKAVETRLKSQWEFPLAPGEAVTVMDGKDEGVYAWITANYLLGNLEKVAKGETYAVLDLGGASTQIAFEPKGKVDGKPLLDEGDHRFELTIAERSHVLYQHSYLDYGLMSARKHVHKLVDFMAEIHANGKPVGDVGNPCLAKGMSRKIDLGDKNVTMVGEEIGSYYACNRIIELVMAKDAICKVKPCSFNGVYQPSILDAFPTGNVFLLSYFYDRLAPLLPAPPASSSPDTPLTLSVSTVASLARKVCEGRPAWLETWGTHPDVMAELQGRPEYCLDLTFMYALLRLGYEFDDKREVKIAKKVDGTELGWCLGATLAVVAGDLRCTD